MARQRKRKREGERKTSSSSCSSFSFQTSLSEGGTNDSDSCAKSYSFGPSTTWLRHNRVKVASRLSPRDAFRSARKVEKGEKKKEKKNT